MELLRRLFSKNNRLSKVSLPASTMQLFEIFDVFYVCFDEPNRQKNWQAIQKVLPKAKKVEGVVGFDRALKTCAHLSKTDHFFVIDGDNQLISERLSRPIPMEKPEDHWVLSWSSRNPLNALNYGNGGLKLWPKNVALSIQSHESSGKKGDQTDYCFLADYYLVDDYVTQTLINETAEQSFRAGFREGVKMTLAWGEQVELNFDNFEESLGWQNRQRLKTWCEVGADSKNGLWAIAGARLGLYKNCIEQFDCRLINSYQDIRGLMKKEIIEPLHIFSSLEKLNLEDEQKLIQWIETLGEKINQALPIGLNFLNTSMSREFKKNFKNPERSGLLKLR